MAEQRRGIIRPVLVLALALVVALSLAACGGSGDGGLSADSVASKIADQTPYEDASCTEETDTSNGGGRSFSCDATTPSGGLVAPGEDATIIVIEEDEGLMATVTVGGQIVDFFAID